MQRGGVRRAQVGPASCVPQLSVACSTERLQMPSPVPWPKMIAVVLEQRSPPPTSSASVEGRANTGLGLRGREALGLSGDALAFDWWGRDIEPQSTQGRQTQASAASAAFAVDTRARDSTTFTGVRIGADVDQ